MGSHGDRLSKRLQKQTIKVCWPVACSTKYSNNRRTRISQNASGVGVFFGIKRAYTDLSKDYI